MEEKKTLSIEESLDRIQEILQELEEGGCSLERSFQLYEQGIRLIASAEGQIGQVEKKLRILKGDEAASEGEQEE